MKATQKIRNLPIAVFVWGLGILLIGLVSTIFMTAYRIISSSLMESNIAYTAQVFSQYQDRIRENSDFLQNMVGNMAYNRTTAKYVIDKDPQSQYENIRNLDSVVSNCIRTLPAIKEVAVEGYNGSFYSMNGRTGQLLEALERLPEEPYMGYDFSQHLHYNGEKNESFLFTTTLYDIWNLTPRFNLGRITVVVDNETLGIQDFSDQYGTGLYLLDPEYALVASNQEPDSAAEEILAQIPALSVGSRMEIASNGKRYIVNYQMAEAIGCHLVSILPRSRITESLNWMWKTVVALLLCALALMVILMAILNHKITAPLKRFSQYIVGMQNQTVRYLKQEMQLDGYREVCQISDEFNRMIGEINTLTHQLVRTTSNLYESELQKKQSELLHLRSQINPHFLYNTLESIMGMAYLEEAPQTAQMVGNLGKIFKYSVKGQDMVPVREELATTRAYIGIQLMRFEGVFQAEEQVDPAILEYRIPKMILQPLVENAITHGLEPKGEDGLLILGGSLLEDGHIRLWVEDNGVGIGEEQLSRFRTVISGEAKMESDSIGVENVVNRLRLLYGERCRLQIDSKEGIGTRVVLEIPGRM